MLNFYKYLPVAVADLSWGLQVLHAGYNNCMPGAEYPDRHHPSHHRFNHKNGRKLHEYALVYITGGRGVYQSEKAGLVQVKGGSAILVVRGEKHIYHPDPETGWTEYWIGFDGPVIRNLAAKGVFTPLKPVFNIGYNETMINLFLQVFDAINNEKTGYQPLVSGAAMYMLGQIHASEKQQQFEAIDEESIVEKARMLMRANIETATGPQQIADELQISYSRFRKLFKAYTGMPPVQYQIQLKIEKAKERLVNTAQSVKEIAFDLNFESRQYFSKQFKEKTNLTPLQFRKVFEADTAKDD